MYCTLLEQFQGAFFGCAIAGVEEVSSSLSNSLTQRSLELRSISFSDGRHQVATGTQALVDVVLVSLLCHDNTAELQQSIQGYSLGLRCFSDAIAARLQRKMPSFDCAPALAHSLRETQQQQLPLQDAARVIQLYPDLSTFDQAIMLGLYCWLCTPHQFMLAVKRSHQLLKKLPDPTAMRLIPTITGVIAGLSVGSGTLITSDLSQATALQQAAHHLYCLWAGILETSTSFPALDETLIAQAGQFKPRTAEHLTLNSDYD